MAFGMLGHAEQSREAARAALVYAYGRMTLREADGCGFAHNAQQLVVQECLDQLRRRRAHGVSTFERAKTALKAVTAAAAARAPVPFAQLTADERRGRVIAEMLRLCPIGRALIVLRHFGEFSVHEINVALGLSTAIVESMLQASRQQLGERLLGWQPCKTVRAEQDDMALDMLGHLLHSVRSAEPPDDVVPRVICQIAAMMRPY